jgi:hypothetical protein
VDLAYQVWSAYYTQMKSISDQRWQPSKETQADVEAARSQTSAYRFAAQVSQISSEFAERPDRVSRLKMVLLTNVPPKNHTEETACRQARNVQKVARE